MTTPRRSDPNVCPRCRAVGQHAPLDDTSTCLLCGTSWQCGDVGQMIAVRHEEAANG